jgi:hypothetical protein
MNPNEAQDLDTMLSSNPDEIISDVLASFDAEAAAKNAEYKLPEFGPILETECVKYEQKAVKSGDNAGKPMAVIYGKTEDGARIIANVVITANSPIMLAVFKSFGVLADGKPTISSLKELVGLKFYASYKANVYQGTTRAAVARYFTKEEYDAQNGDYVDGEGTSLDL